MDEATAVLCRYGNMEDANKMNYEWVRDGARCDIVDLYGIDSLDRVCHALFSPPPFP